MTRSRSGRCVVFDLDDTLYDEVDYVRSGYRAVAQRAAVEWGVDCAAELSRRVESRQFADAFQSIARDAGLAEHAVAMMTEWYRAHAPVIEPRAGIVTLLGALRERDGVLGCITDGRRVAQRAKLEALGLMHFFDAVIVSEETGHQKPDAHNFRELMRRIEATEYWYVGDNPSKDFAAPRELGWRTVGVRGARNIRPLGDGAQPDQWVDERDLGGVWTDVRVQPAAHR